MSPSESWTRKKRKARWIGGVVPVVGFGLAITVAVIWGNPLAISAGHLGRTATAVLAVVILVVVLGVMLPLAIAVGSRAVPAPGYVQPLKLSSSNELMAHQSGSRFQGRPGVSGVAGFVCSDYAQWGPAARIICSDDGFHIEPSHWPVVGRRIVPNLTVRWEQIDALDTCPGERGAEILVVKLGDPRLAFGLWLGPLGSGRLASEFHRHVPQA